MSRRKYFLLKIILCLFLLNLVTVFFYFFSLHHRDHQAKDRKILTENGKTLTENHHSQNQNLRPGVKFHGKPWPILPSYLPWTPNPNVRTRSCEGYFGNGFTQRIDVLKPADHGGGIGGAGGGWFRCFYSETLQSSICEGGRVRMDPEKIKMSKGGEKLEEVIGRKEEVELPEFDFGAFEIENGDRGRNGTKLVDEKFLDRYIPRGAIERHTMRDLLGSIQLVGSDEFQCAEWVEEPTLLVTRFEYANLFHTVTDWYSAYVASRVTALPNRPHLIFVDGHCKTPLEETWEALFSSLRYAKNFSNSVCFRHAILSPLGYETPLFKGLSEVINCQGASAHGLWQNPDDKKTARLSEFGEMIRAAFGFPLRVSKPMSGHNILFVRREDYLAHPRHGGRVQSRLSNEEEVFDYMKRWLANTSKCKVNLVNGLFAHMPLKEQVRAIQDASVIVGAHGAGLTHIVSATPKTVVFEMISSEYRRPHFALISQWKGLDYHPMNLDGSYAKPGRVIDKLSSILSNLGC